MADDKRIKKLAESIKRVNEGASSVDVFVTINEGIESIMSAQKKYSEFVRELLHAQEIFDSIVQNDELNIFDETRQLLGAIDDMLPNQRELIRKLRDAENEAKDERGNLETKD